MAVGYVVGVVGDRDVAPESMTIKIHPVGDAATASWRGDAALASLSTFEEMWISRDEYDEVGPAIVHRKCI